MTCGYDVEKREINRNCQCSDGFWDDGSECRPCILPCTICKSDTFCTYCGS